MPVGLNSARVSVLLSFLPGKHVWDCTQVEEGAMSWEYARAVEGACELVKQTHARAAGKF